MGTILRSKNPKDSDTGFITFQEDLLSRGFARVAEWSIGLSKYVNRLKRAEDKAKRQGLKIWEDYEAPESTLTADDKGVMKARAIEVVSGDMLRVRNLNTLEEERISLSSTRAPRIGFKGSNPEPWSIEAREYIRSKVAGKILHISVDYRRIMGKGRDSESKADDVQKKNGGGNEEERRFCTVLVDNKLNLSRGLISSGLATVVRHGQNDERSSHYFELLQAEKEAISKKLCMHGRKPPLTHHSNDLTGQTTGQVQKYFMLLKDKRVKAIVEKVYSGTRFKLSLPTEYFVINFSVSGIMSPSMGPRNEPDKEKPYAKEALIFSQNNLAMREVDVQIEALDRTGAFVGQIFIGSESHGISLLREGLALTSPIAKRLKNWQEIESAENEARAAKKNIWSLDDVSVVRRERKRDELKTETEAVEEEVTISRVGSSLIMRVTEVVDGTHVFFQTPDSADHLVRLEQIMSQIPLDSNVPSSYTPKEGDLCFAKFAADSLWYRARVVSTDSKSKTAHVFYVDFGNSESAQSWSTMQPIHNLADGKSVPFQAKGAYLSFVRLHAEKYRDQAKEALLDLVDGRDLTARMDYRIGRKQYITLIDPSDNTNINSVLVRTGLVFIDKPYRVAQDPSFAALLDNMELDLDYAKSHRANLWEFGDIYDEDEEDVYY